MRQSHVWVSTGVGCCTVTNGEDSVVRKMAEEKEEANAKAKLHILLHTDHYPCEQHIYLLGSESLPRPQSQISVHQ